MDDFKTIVKNNGILVPNTFFGNIFFNRKWVKAEEAYAIFEERFRQRESEWDRCKKSLEKDWGRPFPAFSQVFKLRPLYFNSPAEAIYAINTAQMVLDSYSLNKEYEFQEKMARLAWFNFKVLTDAPKGCTLIVLKEANYEPSKDKRLTFEASVAELKPCSIRLPDGGIMWLAFKPQNHFDDIKDLKVTAQFCTVEYL